MSFQRERTLRRDRITLLRERVASLKEENATMKKKERDLGEAKEQIFRACLEAEKQRELVLLALRRIVSRKSRSLVVHSKKATQNINSVSSLTCSMFSIKDDISVQDSGLGINGMRGSKDEKRELKLENAKLQSQLLAMAQTIENQKAAMDKKEEDLQTSRRKWKMLDDHSSLLALHAHELSERKQVLEYELEFREKQLSNMKRKNTETKRKIKEKYTTEMRHQAVHIKEMEEATAALEKMNAQLKEDLKERDLHNQATEIVNTAICNSLQENFNEDVDQCLKNNKRLEDELALLKTQAADQETKMAESIHLLEDSRAKCEMYMEKVWKLTLQRDEIKETLGILSNELVLKDKEIESMEMRKTEEITKELMKNESLEREIARCCISQAELEKKMKQQQQLLNSKQVTFETSSILEKACMLDLELLNTKDEQLNLKEECYTEGQELSQSHEKLLNEQDDKISSSTDFQSKLNCSLEQCCKLEELNKELEAKAEQLQLQLDSKEQKIRELDEQVAIFDEELLSKDIAIGQLMMKKAKRRGFRRFFACCRS